MDGGRDICKTSVLWHSARVDICGRHSRVVASLALLFRNCFLQEGKTSLIWVQEDSQGGCLATRASEKSRWEVREKQPCQHKLSPETAIFIPHRLFFRTTESARFPSCPLHGPQVGLPVSRVKLVQQSRKRYKKMGRKSIHAGLTIWAVSFLTTVLKPYVDKPNPTQWESPLLNKHEHNNLRVIF